MKAIILAAGRGSRMRNLTEDQPKCLANLAGKPLIEWQISALRGAGIDEIGVVGGYKCEMLKRQDIHMFTNSRWGETNMVVSLTCASEWLKTNRCVISYADIVYPSTTIRALLKTKADVAITYDTQWLDLWSQRFADPLSDAETFQINSEGYVTEIGNRPVDLDQIAGQYMGLLLFTPAGWQFVMRFLNGLSQRERDHLDMTSMLQNLIHGKTKVAAIPIPGSWYEVDSESDFYLYEAQIWAMGAAHWINRQDY